MGLSDSRPWWDLFRELEPNPPVRGRLPSTSDTLPSGPSGTPAVLAQSAPSARYFNRELVFWALRNLPASQAPKHFLISGVAGSGKTTVIDLFLQSIAPRFFPEADRPEQLIVFDAKGESISHLARLGLHPDQPNYYILNPDDERGAVWNVADAVRSPALARHFATLLIPQDRYTAAPYFPNSARLLLYGTILALNDVAGSHWTLRDLLCAMDSLENIKELCSQYGPALRIIDSFLKDERHIGGILSSVTSEIGALDLVAALWHNAPNAKKFSITSFLSKPGVLVLSNDFLLKESFWSINAILLKSLTHHILGQDETSDPRHWFVFDEFPAMRKVECVADLLTLGRSKGVSVLLGFQGIEQLNEVYGNNAAESMVSQCAHKTFLRAGTRSAEWATQFLGTERKTEANYSESWNSQGSTQQVSYSTIERSVFTTSFFTDMAYPVVGGIYHGVSDVPSLQATLVHAYPFDLLLAMKQKGPEIQNTLSRQTIAIQILWPWSAEERIAFCGDPKKPKRLEAGKDEKAPGQLPEDTGEHDATDLPTRDELFPG